MTREVFTGVRIRYPTMVTKEMMTLRNLFLVIAVGAGVLRQAEGQELTVAAASDLQFAMQEIPRALRSNREKP